MLDQTFETPKPKVIAGAKHDWELVIGLEVHAQVTSKAKLFSGASTQFGAEPNSNVAFVDAGMPGMLPVINEECVAQAVRTGLGLKAQINTFSAFDRKNYFYPDLPQGYQISQLYHPIVGEGEVFVELGDGTARLVRIERIHLEQDAGKSVHDMDPNNSFVDLNRTGVALMEIVSRPDIRGPEEAAPMSPSCAKSCNISAPAMAICKTAACGPMSMSRSAGLGITKNTKRRKISPTLAHAARLRT